MITSKLIKMAAFAVGLATAANSFAALPGDGDIYDIRPCDRTGANVSEYATFENPIAAGGQDLYFKVTLETRAVPGAGNPFQNPWFVKYVGYSSDIIDEVRTPMQIGIYVSGRLEYADLVDDITSADKTKTELIFKYTTRAGDVALPIVLAANTSDGIKPVTTAGADASSYVLNRTDKWVITNAADDECKFVFAQDPMSQPPTDGRKNDTTLAKCGFYVQTIDFNKNWEEENVVWRSVHEGSPINGGVLTPTLEALVPPERAVTLYVWSTDDDVVRVKGGVKKTMIVRYDAGTPETKELTVGTVTFGSNQMSADFTLEGAVGGQGKTCDLVLSAWDSFNYDESNRRYNDYVTVPVKCLEPLPPTLVASVSKDKAYAEIGDGWRSSTTIVDVYLTQPLAEDVEVTITPSILGFTGNVSDYVMFATVDQVKTVSTLTPEAKVKILAGQERSSTKIYAFFLRGDELTSGGATVDFKPTATATGLSSFITGGCEVIARKPEFRSPEENAEFGATAGVPAEIEIEIADTYAAQQIDSGTGYQIDVKYNDALGWKTLPGFYYIGTGGILRDANGKLPELTYATSSAGQSDGKFNTQIRITDPINGERVIQKILASVAAPKSVKVTPERDIYNEGENAKFTIQLNTDNDTGNTLYAFLKAGPSSIKSGMFKALGRNCVLTPDMATSADGYKLTSGLPINPDQGGPGKEVIATIQLLDGESEEIGGSSYYFEVVLCTSEVYDEANVVAGYSSNSPQIQVFNVEPTITRVEMNGYEPLDTGYFDGSYPIGQTQTFQAIVKDGGGFDLDNGFKTRWTITRIGGGSTFPVAVLDGNPNDNIHSVKFDQAGTYKIKTQIKDKDMEDWSAVFSETYIVVVDQPQLTIEVPEVVDENTRGSKISVSLGGYYNAAEPMVVMLTVIPPSTTTPNPGILKLDGARAVAPAGYEAYEGANRYFMLFRGTEAQEIAVTDMDGTLLSSSPGFTIRAEVLNAGKSIDAGKTWAEYYLANNTRYYINNVAPTYTVTETNTNSWKVAGGAATSYPIRWTVRNDVDNDYTGFWDDGKTKGIKVSFTGCENAAEGTTYVTDRTAGTSGVFIPNFGAAQGDQTVTMTIEDKDGGYQTFTYLYTVTPSKFLTTIATGPAGGTSSSALSQKYMGCGPQIWGNLGQGHIYVANGTFSTANDFRIDWNCSKNTQATIYGFGYKVQNPVDDGTLDGGRDESLNPNGDKADANTNLNGNYYKYPFATAEKDEDKRDSFFYCWLLHTMDDKGGLTSTVLGNAISPEIIGTRPAAAVVPLPSEETKDGNYLTTMVEGIFAREWLPSDNYGDINGDGVPDTFAIRTWGSGDNLISMTGGDPIENDLKSLATTNPDEDYLPGVYGGASGSYAPWPQNPFTTRLELRGFHEGLNDPAVSDANFNDDEQAAWEAFADANGIVPATPNLAVWSPEPSSARYPRMDPTIEDTDGDGLPDGWEYYFWYQAHVTKRARPDSVTFERFNIDNILKGTEITADEVEARFNPCVPLSAKEFKDNPDFDGDGLSDLEELLIGTNPCHWDTDGDKMCDGWEVMMSLDPLNGSRDDNPDGDFMAYALLANYVCDQATSDALANGTAQDVTYKCYLNLARGTDYDVNPETMQLEMLRDVSKARYITFTAKYTIDGDPVYYGLPADTPPQNVPQDWITSYQMIDNIVVGTEELTEGTAVFPVPVDLVMIHDQVGTAFGYDPRTAWSIIDGYVADRWNPKVNTSLDPTDATGIAVNTRPYTVYDEYLVMKYRRDYGITYYDGDGAFDSKDPWGTLMSKTTNPNVVYPQVPKDDDANADENVEGEQNTDGATTNKTVSASIAERLEQAFREAGSNKAPVKTHGADTDGDGVPDGWELYMRRNPNSAPEMPMSTEDGLGNPGQNDFDADGLNWAQEFAGTDSCNAYRTCESIYKNHTGNRTHWFNKFFPTNPGTAWIPREDMLNPGQMTMGWAYGGNDDGADTDGDGIVDGMEGANWPMDIYDNGTVYSGGDISLGFIYGSPVDAISCCIRGAGMNPCTVDTDLDGIPDGWEMQHAGVPVDATTRQPVAPLNNGGVGAYAGDGPSTGLLIADGIYQATTTTTNSQEVVTSSNEVATVVYLAGGMDATWPGDAISDASESGASYDDLLGVTRDVDFDHDGLQNFQEYLIQAVRHFRYDDISTPLMGRLLTETQVYAQGAVAHSQKFKGYVTFNAASAGAFIENVIDAWGDTAGRDAVAADPERLTQPWSTEGWRKLGYFAPPANSWDRAIASAQLASPLYMFPVVNGKMATSDVPAGYVTTDPRIADTDGDGMDDYYEMFHGLNPILGTNADKPEDSMWSGGKKGDIISATYDMSIKPKSCLGVFNAYFNEWIFPTYHGVNARAGEDKEVVCEFGPAFAAQVYDPMLYPWIMGTPLVDPDGDGIRNDEERIAANVADPMPLHTDPTPLWFTERTTPASFVSQYYVTPASLLGMPWAASETDEFDTAALAGGSGFEYMFGFEENEGYDTDGDFKFDGAEVVSSFSKATDPNKFDDPDRRQALWFPGAEGYVVSKELQVRQVESQDLFKQFTVECWVRPEEKGRDQTIVDRATTYIGDNIATDAVAIRSNFRIGLYADGRVYGMFDNNHSIESGLNQPISCQRVIGKELPVGKWAHVALTYDGTMLKIYVDGVLEDSAVTQLIPANGVVMIGQNPSSTNSFPSSRYMLTPSSIFLGARPQKAADIIPSPVVVFGIDARNATFGNMRDYYKGWLDQVRVWDGARSAAEIAADRFKRYHFDDIAANRKAVAEAWFEDATRNNNDANEMLPAELVFNYNFQTLPGAIEAKDVAKTPSGFDRKVLAAAGNDYYAENVGNVDTTGMYDAANIKSTTILDDLNVGWWNEFALRNTVYNDYHLVPWIRNTVEHLPFFDGNVIDTFIYADELGAVYTPAQTHGLMKFTFPNTANPYVSVVYDYERYMRRFHANKLVEGLGETYSIFSDRAEYAIRSTFKDTTALVPLGGVYAKTCPLMWDRSAADAWEITQEDADVDYLPDWWEEYAKGKYSPELDANGNLSWDTLVERNGVKMTAGQAYKIDIMSGMQPGVAGTVKEEYAVKADADGDYLPDWWEEMYGISASCDTDDDDGDGLSNWAEYLLSFVFNTGYIFDPTQPKSANGHDLDYFVKIGDLYAGELFSDHDFIEDTLEAMWGADYMSRYKWDANADTDEDGWSNFAEARYNDFSSRIYAREISHYLTGNERKDMPIPTLNLTVRYLGQQNLSSGGEDSSPGGDGEEQTDIAPLVVQTYSDTDLVVPDAKFTVTPGVATEHTYMVGTIGGGVIRGTFARGYIDNTEMLLEVKDMGQGALMIWSLPDDYEGYITWEGIGEWLGTIKDPIRLWRGTYAEFVRFSERHNNEAVIIDSDMDWIESKAFSVIADNNGVKGDIYLGSLDIGDVDLITGEFSLDTAAITNAEMFELDGDIRVNIAKSIMRIRYTSRVPTEQLNKLKLYLGEADSGFVKEGKNTIVAFYDLDTDGKYTAGEPYGVATGVDVGWYKATAEIELTDTSPIITRADIVADATDREVLYGTAGSGDINAERTGEITSGDYERIRVLRKNVLIGDEVYTIKGMERVVMDRWVNLKQRSFITEADILAMGELDLDWTNLYDDIVKSTSSDFSAVAYEIVLGDAPISATTNNSYRIMTVRHFDSAANRGQAVAVSPGVADSVVWGTHPTFKWRIANGLGSYTAFKVQILDGTKVVWDSGFRRTPAVDSDGLYTFEADAYIGDELENFKNYTWRVSVYNSKFKEDAWSKENFVFRMNAPTSGADYGNIPVSVKYFGPANVAPASEFVVEAFTTPDFTGIPAARTVVAQSDLASVTATGVEHTTNVFLIGLSTGNYYLRAYADLTTTNATKRVRDSFESWGYACPRGTKTAMPFSPTTFNLTDRNGFAKPFDIYIEDVDTNGNCLPDAWEYVRNNGKLDNGANNVDQNIANAYAINKQLIANILENVVGLVDTDSFNNYITTAFASPAMTALALGYNPEDITITSSGSIQVESKVESVVITSVGFDTAGNVLVTVDGKLNTAEGNTNGLGFLTLVGQSAKTVTCTVYYKETLAQADWDVAATRTINVGSSEQTIDINGLGKAASGFFKVTITE